MNIPKGMEYVPTNDEKHPFEMCKDAVQFCEENAQDLFADLRSEGKSVSVALRGLREGTKMTIESLSLPGMEDQKKAFEEMLLQMMTNDFESYVKSKMGSL